MGAGRSTGKSPTVPVGYPAVGRRAGRPQGEGKTRQLLDHRLRAGLAPALERPAGRLARVGFPADLMTAVGLGLGLAGAVALGGGHCLTALVLFLAGRLADGLDGPVARLSGRMRAPDAVRRGGYVDLGADMIVYIAYPVALAVGRPGLGTAVVCLLGAYALNLATLVAASRSGRFDRVHGDGRSLVFTPGLVEGAETIAVYSLWTLFPSWSALLLWLLTGAVVITAVQRLRMMRTVRAPL